MEVQIFKNQRRWRGLVWQCATSKDANIGRNVLEMFSFRQDGALKSDRNASSRNLINFVAAKSAQHIMSINANLTRTKACNRLGLDDAFLGEPL